MEWIQGVEYEPSGVRLKTITTDRKQFHRPISELKSLLPLQSNFQKLKGKTSFSDWRKMDLHEVAVVALAFGFTEVQCDHVHYMFESEGKRYIVPAGALMSALFRPFHGIAKYLFAPQGLDNLCMPYGNCKNPDVLFFKAPRATTGMQPENAKGIVNSLSWMHCFSSARQMWGSVLEHAKAGQLELTLPDATIDYSCIGHQLASGDTVIQRFRIRLIETHEKPLEHFSNHTKVIELERVLHKLDFTYPKDLGVPLRGGESSLTDSEWELVKQCLIRNKGFLISRDLRQIVDIQLKKLSQGLKWGAVVSEDSELYICRRYLTRWKADGRWEQLMQALTRLRS